LTFSQNGEERTRLIEYNPERQKMHGFSAVELVKRQPHHGRDGRSRATCVSHKPSAQDQVPANTVSYAGRASGGSRRTKCRPG
jgi:hypothetical protein